MILCSLVLIQYRRVADRQTDLVQQSGTLHRLAMLRDNNGVEFT